MTVGWNNAVIEWDFEGGNSDSSVDYYIQVLYRVFEKNVHRVQLKEDVPKGKFLFFFLSNFNVFKSIR